MGTDPMQRFLDEQGLLADTEICGTVVYVYPHDGDDVLTAMTPQWVQTFSDVVGRTGNDGGPVPGGSSRH